MSEFSFSPLRSIDDFLIAKARFQRPKFSLRIISNLLYYQTNYFLMTAFIFLLFGLLSPYKMLWALIVSGIGGLAIVFSSGRLRKQSRGEAQTSNYQTYLLLAIVITTAFLLLYNFSSIAILLSSLLLSVILALIHASMRTRNLKNKIRNTIDKVSMKKTPMNIILETFNISSDDFLN